MPHTTTVRRGRRTRGRARCLYRSSNTKSGSGGSSGSTPTSPQGPTTTTKGSSADTQWALNYTAGKGGKATGTPFTIGYANEDIFPEATIGLAPR